MPTPPSPCLFFLFLLFFMWSSHSHLGAASDADALLALKSALDRSDRLPWRRDTAPALCSSWLGVRQCSQPPRDRRVTKLVLENLNLTGVLTATLLAPLSELRVLSLKSNALTGPIPDALPAALPNLKLLYLSANRLQGRIPPTLALLHRATVLVLSSNLLHGAEGLLPGQGGATPRLRLLPQWQPLLPPPRVQQPDVEQGEAPALDVVHEDRGGCRRRAGAPAPVAAGWHRARQPQALQRPPRPRLRIVPHRLRSGAHAAPLPRRSRLLHVRPIPSAGNSHRPCLHAGVRRVQLRRAPPGAAHREGAVPGPDGDAQR
ncbi:Os02g0830700 [Oryza sativa Japonica Group]|uniref:Os02g0830700 protein n=2 Tax=Oryza sativa subsp. japonica TaxID=39947 RepID=A0A0P0VRM3_ORYSJ|nr:hypothetical protein EE612_014652 [Oryza sativa]BAD22952.1 receptor kinase-like [Oryza sativa Japonica Group]BAF10528.1 Os02g0830700 [Oryza sativa Japonica Group]BAS81747.1 Os02g0830700 [Oryza sativa Japonica Group]|eukprot:NP_001048614.1 Os02g0830700 [Oryza sativa Japonica Group]